MLKDKCVSDWELGNAFKLRSKERNANGSVLLWIIHQGEYIRIAMKFYVFDSIVNNAMNCSQWQICRVRNRFFYVLGCI